MPRRDSAEVLRCRVTSPLKEAFTALADALAKRPAEEILFDWFRSGRLVGELSVLIKRRHPDVQARIDRPTRTIWRSLAKGGVTRQARRLIIFGGFFCAGRTRSAKPRARPDVSRR